MAPSGDLELALKPECVQDESDVPPCEYCSNIRVTNIEELPLGVAENCSNCRLLLDAIETWNETENLQLYKHFSHPGNGDSFKWFDPWITLQPMGLDQRWIFLRVSPNASMLFPTFPCSTHSELL